MENLKENKVLKEEALDALKGNWSIAVLVATIYSVFIILQNTHPFLGFITFIMYGAVVIGINSFYLALSRKQQVDVKQIFAGFDNRFLTYLWAFIITIVKTILWSLLLIIPGIIAAIRYSQTFFILVEDHSISANDAIEKSKKIMEGHKMKYFWLMFSFIGWWLLCLITLGIGSLWFIPYLYTTQARFYDNLKNLK